MIASIAGRICGLDCGHPVRVAVDGVTASGKTSLARELAAAVAGLGRPVIGLSMDGFHHPRARRHQQGRLSAAGYYQDAYDFAAFARWVLVPLGPTGERRYRTAIIDLATDRRLEEPAVQAPADAVLIVDGSFLQRPELAGHWDLVIFVDTSLALARARGVRRDAEQLGGRAAAEQLYDLRYHAAGRHYLQTVRPAERAAIVLANDDLAAPTLLIR
ncbi:MAG: uridylate kinase [Jatrophihabitans sp.]